ncbi:MAG: serine/threonine protein kinase [Phycisphaerales bacterium]|nr:MAG: serine/threonine protein kinase [Phycisphaerales bacterium]
MSMLSGEDSQIGRKVVEHKLATADELAMCEARLNEQIQAGKKVTLADVLVESGYVTRSQVERLTKALDDDSMYRPAQQIPGFQILGKIGQGAMATVFKAKQLSLDRIVAIKVLPRRLSDNPEFVDRFYREGRAAARLNHANIVQAIDVGEAGGYHYFVMEYIDGDTVYDRLAAGKRFDETEAVNIILQCAKALAHAHSRGFIHRDVKPKNVMITKESQVKLADMGLAREVSDYETATAEAGRAYGTPYYISPEQIRGEISIDFRADVYSLGATFYHMVTGKVPFDGPTPSAVMHRHLKEPLVPPDHLNTTLSAGIGEIIEVMMAKKRDDRYATTKELISDLQGVLQGEAPFQARKRYDQSMLQSIADTGETVSIPTADDLSPPEPNPTNWTAILLLAAFLGLSLLLNLAQCVMQK